MKKHSFFIPFAEYLIDLDGLLTYLGAKVGMGKVCLWCNGRGRAFYPTLDALQKHMSAKSHCKIRFEEDEDDDEFLPYYRFPYMNKDPEEEPATDGAMVISMSAKEMLKAKEEREEEAAKEGPRRTPASMNDAGELVMSDGSIIGHRTLNRAYKQNIRPETETSIIDSIVGEYKRLALPGYAGVPEAKYSETNHFMRKIVKAQRTQINMFLRQNHQKHFRSTTAHLM